MRTEPSATLLLRALKNCKNQATRHTGKNRRMVLWTPGQARNGKKGVIQNSSFGSKEAVTP
jgi:hypothetical protein